MTSLCRHLSAPEIVNWVTTADGCVHTDDTTKLLPTSFEFVYTPPMRRDSTVSSRRRRQCVLGFKYQHYTKCKKMKENRSATRTQQVIIYHKSFSLPDILYSRHLYLQLMQVFNLQGNLNNAPVARKH